MPYALISAVLRVVSWLPLRWLAGLAVPLGRLARRLPWRQHAVIETNLKLCFPHLDVQQRERLHRRHLVEMVRLGLEAGAVWYWPRKRLLRHVPQVDGWEAVVDEAATGRGVLLVGAHFSNWEILPLWVSTQLPGFTALYRAPDDDRLDRRITHSRSRFGARLVASGGPAMRMLLATLKRGGVIGMLADQQPKQGQGVFAPFFGVEARTMTLVNRLARHTGCAVFYAGCRRLPKGKGWVLDFTPAGAAAGGDDPVEAVRDMHRWLEAKIEEDPPQYLWNYKRFSLRPNGEPSPYPPRKSRRRAPRT